MNPELLRLIIPLLLILAGILLRKSQRDSDQAYKKYGIFLIVIGTIAFILKFVAFVY